MTLKPINTNIRRINTNPGSVFNIIETPTDLYYCLNDNSAPPKSIDISKWSETCHIYIPHGENNEYWAYNKILSRETLILYKADQEIYQFEEPALGFTLKNMNFINFHILYNRWVIVFLLCRDDNKVICRTHDILKKQLSQTHLLADLNFPISQHSNLSKHFIHFIYTYTIGNQIIIFTPEQIAKLGVQKNDGTRFIRLDFTMTPSTILKQIRNSLDGATYPYNSFIHVVVRNNSDVSLPNLLVYKNSESFKAKDYHCLTGTKLFLGMVNTNTLETIQYHSYTDPTKEHTNPEFSGVYEYLAPDIIIHRSDVYHLQEQYLTLLVPSEDKSDNTPVQIRINIHEFEYKMEQRKYYNVDMSDNGEIFTLVYNKSQDTTWTVYQVNRQARTIIHMIITKPKTKDIHIEITKDHQIRVYNFNLNRDTIQTINPSTANMLAILTSIPEPMAILIGKFTKQKIINY